MFVAIDKATAVRMYAKVQREWAAELAAREKRLTEAPAEARGALTERLDWMRSVDMAVVVIFSRRDPAGEQRLHI
jgi:type I restriction enzyme R subunit